MYRRVSCNDEAVGGSVDEVDEEAPTVEAGRERYGLGEPDEAALPGGGRSSAISVKRMETNSDGRYMARLSRSSNDKE